MIFYKHGASLEWVRILKQRKEGSKIESDNANKKEKRKKFWNETRDEGKKSI